MPIFENKKDREHQSNLAWILEYTGYEVQETSTLCGYDFILRRRGREHAVAEYKRRTEPLRDPYYIDEHKVRRLIGAAIERKVKPILIVSGPTPPYYWMVASLDFPTKTFTRKKNGVARGETEDTVLQIPLTAFSVL